MHVVGAAAPAASRRPSPLSDTTMNGAGDARRIAVVCNRFGRDVAGGAELVMAELGRGLRQRGWNVEVVTSAARDLYTWANEFPEGESMEDGIRVRRFHTVVDRRSRERDRVGHLIGMGADVPIRDQYRWMNAGVRVPGMFEYLVDCASQYRAIVLAPYPFWTTFACAGIAPRRTILLPCLHDEPPAHLEIFKPMFEGCLGVWFQTEPERALARSIFQLPRHHAVIGSGVDVPARYDPEGFRRRHDVDGDFVLFAGRREWGKSWPDLVSGMAFANATLPTPLSLVTCGVGETGPAPSNTRLLDLGYLSDEERSNAMAAATVYAQPSAMESFSRTVMEAWLAGTVVVANAASQVVRWHCERSGAGLVYQDRYELTECIRVATEHHELAAAMAARGRRYVLDNYRWDGVLDRVERSLEDWAQ
jgi:glycosyltransferase involved in cell wall biosynthesis